MSSMFRPFKRYADFQGRSGRKEYWMFQLFQILVGIAITLVSSLGAYMDSTVGASLGVVFTVACALVTFIPGIAVSVRRIHDIDKSGWQLLWAFVPILGPLILLFFLIKEGTNGANRYGQAPVTR